jgi:uncharacterized protein YrrD
MLRTLNDLTGMSIGAADGFIGRVKDAYFEDCSWTIRYLVVDTGGWLSRKVLISTLAIESVNWEHQVIDVHMTRAQVKDSPEIDTDKPVSRRHELLHLDHYGLPHYWARPMLWGAIAYPTGIAESVRTDPLQGGATLDESAPTEDSDHLLRSCKVVSGYHIEANDGDIGHIDDYLFDEESWSIRYLLINTRNWLRGKRVIVASDWIQRISWNECKAYVDLSRETIEQAPAYDRDYDTISDEEAQSSTDSLRPLDSAKDDSARPASNN